VPAAALLVLLVAPIEPALADDNCGALIQLETRSTESIAYSYRPATTQTSHAALVLLAGGGGAIDLDNNACPRALTGNTLVRIRPLLQTAGFATALVDASSDQQGSDGLGGFRTSIEHAGDLGKIIADLRTRTGLPVYVLGSSRGTISAANAASRLKGAEAPDGMMLFSPITSGRSGGQKAWVAQTVFDLPLRDVRIPLLVISHRDDSCIRTPPDKAREIVAKAQQAEAPRLIVMEGGSGGTSRAPSVEACSGSTPHGFVGLDNEVVALISDFIRQQR